MMAASEQAGGWGERWGVRWGGGVVISVSSAVGAVVQKGIHSVYSASISIYYTTKSSHGNSFDTVRMT